MYEIGVVGYSAGQFDTDHARGLIEGIMNLIAITHIPAGESAAIVSGWTNMGIPALAYEYARANNWTTVGVACARAGEYDVFPCDLVEVVGEEWGDESDTFLNRIDCLVRIGGGKQSLAEVKTFRERFPDKPCFEMELERYDETN